MVSKQTKGKEEMNKVKIVESQSLKYQNALNVFVWAALAIPVYIFAAYSLSIVYSFNDERMELMSLIFFMYVFMKLVYWVGMPRIVSSRSYEQEIKSFQEEK
jgi:hypothetical protein